MKPLKLLPLVLALLCVAMLAAPAIGQVAIVGPAGSVCPREDALLKVTGIAPADLGRCKLIVWPKENVTAWPVTSWTGEVAILFEAKAIGKYLVAVAAPAEAGVQLAECVVVVQCDEPTPTPDPDPTPDPTPAPGKRFVLVLHETAGRTPEQTATIQALQAYCREKNHAWRVEDQDQADAWLATWKAKVEAAGQPLPVLIVAAMAADGSVVQAWIEPLPATPQAALAIVQQHGG